MGLAQGRHIGQKDGDPIVTRWRMTAATGGPEESTDVAAKTADEHARHIVISCFDSPSNQHYGGGGAAVATTLAHHLAEQFDVTYVTAARHSGTRERDGVRYRYLPVSWAGPRAGQLLFQALLPFVAWRGQHDLWIESFTSPFSTGFLPIFSRAPVIGFAQVLSGQAAWRKYRIPFFLVERFGLHFYRHVIVLNPADGAEVRRYARAARVTVIPNGVDHERPDDAVLGQGEYALFLGRIDVWEKGLDLLLAAYSQSGIAMPLLIAGGGTRSEERKLTTLLAAADDDVRWIGRVTGQRKDELLACSAFVVVSSRREAFSLVALEGMVHGKPVIHFNLPTLQWLGEDGRIPAFDIAALASEMRLLAGDEALRRGRGRAALAIAQAYGTKNMLQRHTELVCEILNMADAGDSGKEIAHHAEPHSSDR